MFGYIRPFQPELKMREYEAYRSVYCGLCHTLGKRYTFIARFFLTYDLTWLAMLTLSLQQESPAVCKRRCVSAPFRPHPTCVQNEATDFAADCAMLLLYYKLKDNLHDASLPHKIAAAILLLFSTFAKRKAEKRQPEAAERITKAMQAQDLAEKNRVGIDAAADPTGQMMADLLLISAHNTENERILSRFGYFMGRWVYLMDATDDLDQDIHSGDYNPFACAWKLNSQSDLKAARKRAQAFLNSCLYEMQAAFALLSVRYNAGVMENTLTLGLPHMQHTVVEQTFSKQR